MVDNLIKFKNRNYIFSDADIQIVSRKEWGAWPLSKSPITKFWGPPADQVIIKQSDTKACNSRMKCIEILHNNIAKNELDFTNFFVGGDGTVYEGSGWDSLSCFINPINRIVKNIKISLIGQFKFCVPNERQLYTTLKLIELGVNNRKITRDYKVKAFNQVYCSENSSDLIHFT